jgi:hypothetical protein
MKYLLLFFFISILCFNSSGQKTIREKIWSAPFSYLTIQAIFSVDEKNNKNLETVLVMGQDSRYRSLTSIISLFSGSPKECSEWFNKLIDIIDQEKSGTSINIENQTVSVHKSMGQTILYVDENGIGGGYNAITKSRLEKALYKLDEWITENPNLAYSSKPKMDTTDTKSKMSIIPKNPKDSTLNVKPVLIADELIKLKKLLDEGVLTKDEFELQKKKLLGQ